MVGNKAPPPTVILQRGRLLNKKFSNPYKFGSALFYLTNSEFSNAFYGVELN